MYRTEKKKAEALVEGDVLVDWAGRTFEVLAVRPHETIPEWVTVVLAADEWPFGRDAEVEVQVRW